MFTAADLPSHVAQQLTACAAQRWVVGYSGGLDSTVLLWLCKRFCEQSGLGKVQAVHINHQLSPHARSWQQHCQTQCDAWGVPLDTLTVQVDRRNGGLEQAAREARYAAFRQICHPGDALMLAHHANDQVETFLLRALRGSGPAGLSAMQSHGTWQGLPLLRPLLAVSRSELARYANVQQLTWVEDESNTDERLQRNFLRHRVVPLLSTRWSATLPALARSARLIASEHQVLMRLIGQQASPDIDLHQRSLALLRWYALPQDEQVLWLRYWLAQIDPALPSEAVLTELLRQAASAAEDAAVQVQWGQRVIRRFRHCLYCVDVLPEPEPAWMCAVTLQARQPLSAGLGAICWQAGAPEGQRGLRAGSRQPHWVWRLRQGGERFQPAGRANRPLKKWLQESALPPWLRDRLPLLYAGDRLLGVPGLGVIEELAAEPNKPAEWMVWEPPGSGPDTTS